MTIRSRRSDCPVNFGLETFGDKWTLLIVRDLLLKGKRHYNEFLGSEEKIATNILASRLELLENAGIVVKMGDPEHASRFIYRLTHKGIDLLPVLFEIILWSAKYDESTAVDPKFVRRIKRDRAALLKEVSDQLIRS